MSKPEAKTLDEILRVFGKRQRVEGTWGDDAIPLAGHPEAKQAIIDAIKRAKPEKYENAIGDSYGYNVAIDEFEQNIMKELGL